MQKTIKYFPLTLLVLTISAAILAIFHWQEVKRLQATITLFDEDKIVYNFSHLNKAFNTVPIKRSGAVFHFGSAPHALPEVFSYEAKTKSVDEFLARRASTALLVIKNDNITHEQYFLGTQENDLRISWSVGKSFISTLFGIAVDQGLIDIAKSVTDYLPELSGSGYEAVRLKDVLQMSSGVAWNEDYGDFNSDINRMGRVMSLGGSLDVFASTLINEHKPGSVWRYVSMDTHVLGMVLRRATGSSLPHYMEKHLWSKLGAEADGYWLTDTQGAAFALGGINIRTRDFARFGRLLLNNGKLNAEQIVSESWIKASTTADAQHISPGSNSMGYGFQWWLGPNPRPGEFMAIGVYGQYIYVNQAEDLVIVLNSADRGFMDQIGSMRETTALLRAIADSFE